ncbi:hypothetical protein DVH24_038559 [Malus domestica]|uniref:Uncharacterized protein n=1 Tax=Malus domestica TaxID=3750 RepID=A0A498KEW5_MALDO|nr:hypothetical protein DVH24_038559 [Malus domestica]
MKLFHQRAAKATWGRYSDRPMKLSCPFPSEAESKTRTINVNESAMVKKSGSVVVQALVRVAVKNGVPLFTFAFDNDIAILAATMKKLNTSKNDDCSCICTFFSIREVKKKAATWMHQGSKSKSHDYVGNVVAQMKVADSHFQIIIINFEIEVQEYNQPQAPVNKQ